MEQKKMTQEEIATIKEMLAKAETFDDLEKAHLLGYMQGMADASELKKKEAS